MRHLGGFSNTLIWLKFYEICKSRKSWRGENESLCITFSPRPEYQSCDSNHVVNLSQITTEQLRIFRFLVPFGHPDRLRSFSNDKDPDQVYSFLVIFTVFDRDLAIAVLQVTFRALNCCC